jgi:hypothetical protein
MAPTTSLAPNGPPAAGPAADPGPLPRQVQTGLNLLMPMKSPAQMPGLLKLIDESRATIYQALTDLHSVHFARFLPVPDGSGLWVITTFDGDLNDYLMDFVAALGKVFNVLLSYIAGAPPLPVERYPREFCQFVADHNLEEVPLWSAYRDVTVVDILHDLPAL